MGSEIVINACPEETRVALLENKIVTELYIDRKKDRGIVGNIYKGRVVKVLPGMQAAFVDIGTEKAAFLYVSDVMANVDEYAKMMEEAASEPVPVVAVPTDELDLAEGGRGPEGGGDSDGEGAAIQENEAEGDGELEVEEMAQAESPALSPAEGAKETRPQEPQQWKRKGRRGPRANIEDLLTEGQEVVVQVTKEPIGTKGPRATTYISLPGRYLVFMPTINHVGVSRRIASDEERRRLKETISRLKKPGHGYIIRTVSEGTTEEEFKGDIQFLEVLWQDVLKKKESASAPALLHSEMDLVFRTVRDLFTKEVDRLTVDNSVEYDRLKEFMSQYMPDLLGRLYLWDKEEPVFDAYGLEIEISKGKGRRVWLKSGGYIVIDLTEALTVIDVNTGRYVGRRDLEETILKTNLEAAKEIAYQLRLRNIGGIIIIDFIDMERERNRDKVFKAFSEALSADKARTNILRISELGLVEMSRERTREDLLRILSQPCLYCEGRGYTKSPTTICYEIFREIRRIGASPRDRKVIVGAHPSVAGLMYEEERQTVEELERECGKKIIIKADPNLHIEQYDIVTL